MTVQQLPGSFVVNLSRSVLWPTLGFVAMATIGLQQVVLAKMGGAGISVGEIFIVLTVALGTLSWAASRQWLWDRRLPVAMLAGLSALTLSWLLSEDKAIAFRFLVRYGLELGLLFVAVAMISKQQAVSRGMARGAVWFMVLNAVLAVGIVFAPEPTKIIAFNFNHPETLKYLPRISGTYEHPAILGSIAVMGGMLSVHAWRRRVIGHVEASIGVLSALIILTLGGSRNPWFALVSVAALAAFFIASAGNWKRSLVWIAALISAAVLIYAVHPLTQSRMDQSFAALVNLDWASLTSRRTNLWAGAIAAWLDHPWFGLGPGVFQYQLNDYVRVPMPTGEYHAHDLALAILSETGIVGLTAFGIASIAIFGPLVAAVRGSADSKWVAAWIVLLVSLQMFDFYFHSYGFMAFTICSLAFLYGEYVWPRRVEPLEKNAI